MKPVIPEKPLFHVEQVVWIVAPYLCRRHESVKRAIYNQIDRGAIKARRVLGRLMIPREEVEKIIDGEPL